MGSALSMVKKTYVIGRCNRNAPNLYRTYNCYDHLFPYELTKNPKYAHNIKLAILLEAFNLLVTHKLSIEPHISILKQNDIEIYKNVISPEKILRKLLVTSPDAQDLKIELDASEQQIYLCRNYITEFNEEIANLRDIIVFQTCCNYLQSLPCGIGQLTRLKLLILTRNRLVELPEEIGLCKDLREIDVSFNLLNRLPRSLVGLKKLNTLHLTGNFFTELPSFLGKLYSLKFLHVGYNSIRNVPLEIFKLPFLLTLTADNCKFSKIRRFKEVGDWPTLKEITSRKIVKNNLNIYKTLSVSTRLYFLKVQECSFCGGPFFEEYIEVEDFHTFESEVYPVKYRMCSIHYKTHDERLRALFETHIASFPAKLMQDGALSVTELFVPFCFNADQARRMTNGLYGRSHTMPLICLANYNTSHYNAFDIEKLLGDPIENFNIFDQDLFS